MPLTKQGDELVHAVGQGGRDESEADCVRTIVTQEFAIWSVTIVKIRSYSTKTAIVTYKSGCWSVRMDVYHIAEETGETLTVWQIKDSGECIASLSDVRVPD